jgi:hypothetical protein
MGDQHFRCLSPAKREFGYYRGFAIFFYWLGIFEIFFESGLYSAIYALI